MLAAFLFTYRLLRWGQRKVNVIFLLARGVHCGIWLGLLEYEKWFAFNYQHYGSRTNYDQEAYNLRGLANIELAMIERHFKPRSSVLVAGAGGGREMIALERIGFEVSGFECNGKLVEHANELLRAQNCRSRVQLVPPDECPANETTYDAILVGWGVYIHIIPKAKRVAFLSVLRSKLKDGGKVIVGICMRRPVHARFYTVAALSANCIRRIRRRDLVEFGDKLEPTLEHHFDREETVEELQSAGFRVNWIDDTDPGRSLVGGELLKTSD